MNRRWITGVALATSLALLAPTAAIAKPAATPAQARGPQQAQGQGPDANNGRFSTESRRLAAGLADALVNAGWGDLVDHNVRVNGLAQQVRALPNVDVAVIELSRQGHVVGAANVLLDRDKPDGFVVPIDSKTLAPSGVEFTQWRSARWENPAQWAAGPAPADVLTGAGSDVEFMLPYPASVLKVMTAYGVLRAIDQGVAFAGTPLTVSTVFPSRGCSASAALVNRTVEVWLDRMMTFSNNDATCAMHQLLEQTGQLDEVNRHFVEDLGLTTFRLFPGNRTIGSVWLDPPARMTMGAMDTAKLLLLVSGSTRNLWRGPDGEPITADVLSPESRAVFQRLLDEQGFHEVMSTGNLCGSEDTVPGIPALVPNRWIRASDGHAVVPGVGDYGFDVRPCNDAAEVTFAHKTGLISIAGNDAGIVRALPGEDGRWYVVAMNASVGSRFSDAQFARQGNPCLGAPFICYPRPFPRMGAAIDQLVKDRPNNVR